MKKEEALDKMRNIEGQETVTEKQPQTAKVEKQDKPEKAMTQDEKEEAYFDEKVDAEILYETNPEKVDKDIVVNTCERSFILPRYKTNSTIRLLQGERVKGKYYARMVEENPGQIPGLALACKLTGKHLETLEKLRKKNSKEEPSAIVKEIWAKKGQNTEEETKLSTRRR